MDLLQVQSELGLVRKCVLAEFAFVGLKFHVNALRVVFEMRDVLESLSAAGIRAAIKTQSVLMCQHVLL